MQHVSHMQAASGGVLANMVVNATTSAYSVVTTTSQRLSKSISPEPGQQRRAARPAGARPQRSGSEGGGGDSGDSDAGSAPPVRLGGSAASRSGRFERDGDSETSPPLQQQTRAPDPASEGETASSEPGAAPLPRPRRPRRRDGGNSSVASSSSTPEASVRKQAERPRLGVMRLSRSMQDGTQQQVEQRQGKEQKQEEEQEQQVGEVPRQVQ